MQHIVFSGYVLSKPEEALHPNGAKSVSFFVSAKNGGTMKDNAYYRCTYYGRVIPEQGDHVFVTGRLTIGIKEDENGDVFPDLFVRVFDLVIGKSK